MPVEIKELVIRAVVQKEAAPKGDKKAGAGGDASSTCCPSPEAVAEQQDLVAATVKEVFRILRASKER